MIGAGKVYLGKEGYLDASILLCIVPVESMELSRVGWQSSEVDDVCPPSEERLAVI